MKTIEEKNRMIAEFMGYSPETMNVNVVRPDGYTRAKNVTAYQIEPKRHDDLPNLTADYMLKYHTSWDWLMPVVEEIDHLEYESERLDKIEGAIKTRQIGSVHEAVIQFIEWYNENK